MCLGHFPSLHFRHGGFPLPEYVPGGHLFIGTLHICNATDQLVPDGHTVAV